jgi:hypothetical protein
MKTKPVKYTGDIRDKLRVKLHPAIGRYVLEASEIADIPFQSAVEMALCFGSTAIIKAMRKIKQSKNQPSPKGKINIALCDSLMAVFGYHRVKKGKRKK